MYRDFYHLHKQPFHITPDPEFLFLSPSHREAFAAIIYGIEQRKGFLAITGEVGVGKTTILRAYLEKTGHEQHRIIYVFNAAVSFSGLLKLILGEFGVAASEDDPFEMVNRLHHLLIDEYQNNRNVVLIIDEAQNMPVATLESLRMLSNLETSEDKLLQIILVGQPELARLLDLHELRQLRQRIAVRCQIDPLTRAESLAYIQHRLARAATHGGVIFAPGALQPIIKEARGIPRIINILCDNALLTGFGYQQKPITRKIVKEVVAEHRGSKPRLRRRWWLAPFAVAAVVVLTVLVGFLLASPHAAIPKSVAGWGELLTQVLPLGGLKGNTSVSPVQPNTPPAPLKGGLAPRNAEGTSARPGTGGTSAPRNTEVMTAPLDTGGTSATRDAGVMTAPLEAGIKPANAAAGPAPAVSAPGEGGPLPATSADSPLLTERTSQGFDTPPGTAAPQRRDIDVISRTAAPREQTPGVPAPPANPSPAPPGTTVANRPSAPSPLTPDASPLTPHASPLTPDASPLTATVKPGDCISHLVTAVYGHVDNKLIQAVKNHNPHIRDINLIRTGDRIAFPLIDGMNIHPDSEQIRSD